MAKLVGPLHSIAASGKLGPLIYSRNQYGFYTWEPPAYVDAPTQNQIDWRNAFAAAVTAWESGVGMTNALRDMWQEFAQNYPQYDRLGRKFTGTGRQRFIQNNMTRLYAGLSFHAAPPVHPTCRIFPVVTLSQEDAGLYATLDPVLAGDDLFVCSSVLNQSLLRNFMPHSQTTAGVFKSGDSHPFLIAANADLDAEEKRHFFKWRCVDGDGRPGPQQINYIDAEKTGSSETTLVVSGDTFLYETLPDTNFYTDATLQIRNYDALRITSLLTWDLSSLAGATIVSATIYLRSNVINNAADHFGHHALVSWIDSQATWNNRLTGTGWNTPGGGAGTDYATDADFTINISSGNTWYNVDVTDLVTNWVEETWNNYGIFLIRTDAGSGINSVKSLNNGDPTLRPYLFITYYP